MRICSVGTAFPGRYYGQDDLLAELKRAWGHRFYNSDRLEQIHRAVSVGGRYLALPVEDYEKLSSFTDSNNAYIRVATELGAEAVLSALEAAALDVADIDHLLFASITGLATPSIDARLVNRLGLREDVKRTPIFGLGCLAGSAGVARAADYVRAFPEQTAVVLSVELCSLTLQRTDTSMANIIASGLFGDGAASVVVRGSRAPVARNEAPGMNESTADSSKGPEVVATRSVFYRDTEDVMGWEFGGEGFRLVLSGEIPDLTRQYLRRDVDGFLAQHLLSLPDIQSYVCHPGGPKVLRAIEEVLDLHDGELDVTWRSLRDVGNLSSASVLVVLRETMLNHRPPADSYGLMMSMGPGFCAELVLLRW